MDRGCGCGVFLADDVFLAGEDQVDHTDQIGFEFRLIVSVAPRGVAASAFDFAEVSEVARDSDQDIVDEDGRISFDAVAISQLRAAEIFADERDSTRIFGCNFLDQQTCWVGDVSSVGPADESDVHRLAGRVCQFRGGFLRRVVRRQDLVEDHSNSTPFVGGRNGTVGMRRVGRRALSEKVRRWNRRRKRLFQFGSLRRRCRA